MRPASNRFHATRVGAAVQARRAGRREGGSVVSGSASPLTFRRDLPGLKLGWSRRDRFLCRRPPGAACFGFNCQRAEEGKRSHSRGEDRPSFAAAMSLSNKEGAGKAGCPSHPWSACRKKHAAEPQVRAEQPAFPAQWFYGLYVLSPVTRLFATVAADRPRRLSASLGAPGPYDFGVLSAIFVRPRNNELTTSRPSHPAPNVRDDREAPLLWRRDAQIIVLICPTAQPPIRAWPACKNCPSCRRSWAKRCVAARRPCTRIWLEIATSRIGSGLRRDPISAQGQELWLSRSCCWSRTFFCTPYPYWEHPLI